MTTGMPDWLDALRGRFIVLDGPDGSGKSTQFRRLAGLARGAGLPMCEVRDPGGTEIGERVRAIVLDPVHQAMDMRCEMLLYMASRAQLVAQRIRPALAQGMLVLADRFISSTLAYQGAAGGLDPGDIRRVGDFAVAGCWPDLTLLLDVDEATAARRRSAVPDRIEQRDAAYRQAVREGFLRQAQADPARHRVIDARADEETVFQSVVRSLESWSRA